ncbi:MAG: hypothetical protein GC160_18435 [Acidobacteria bacterium]|nr:hypothetical protein [Acidobacteriota bacterium]
MAIPRILRHCSLGGLLLSLWLGGALRAESPKLTVVLVAEQFRADYLERYADEFGPDGLRRLIENGAVFPRMRYETASSWAAPAAATLATGAWANGHGIVADAWFDQAEGRVVRATESAQGPAPNRLVGSTFADELFAATDGRARIVAISGDPTAAVLLGGRRPRGCYWRGESGAWQSSSFYGASLPKWVSNYVSERALTPAGRRLWIARGAPADAPALRVLDTEGFLQLYQASPFAIDDLFAFGLEALKAEKLGKRGQPDLLILSLSAPARLALETGADSPLMHDLILRLDDAIAKFLAELDREVGLDSTLVAFTGLHGAPPQREQARLAGFISGAIPGDRIAATVDDVLQSEFGDRIGVRSYVYPFLQLTASVQRRSPLDRQHILEAAGRAATTEPGVALWYSPLAPSALGERQRLFENASYPGRSGDLILAYEPYYSEAFGDGRGVTPGSMYRYDTETPLILMGSAFRPGRYEGPALASSFASTLTAALGLATPSSATGEPLVRAMRGPGQPVVGPPSPLP